jgi:hypothetical protein
MITKRLSQVWLVIALVIGIPACKGKKDDSGAENENEKHEATNLKQFALTYQLVIDNDDAPPKSLDYLLERMTSDRPFDFDNYVIIWGVDLADFAGQNDTILARRADEGRNGRVYRRFGPTGQRRRIPKAPQSHAKQLRRQTRGCDDNLEAILGSG